MVKQKEEDVCDPLEVPRLGLFAALVVELVEVVAFAGKEPTTDVRNEAKLEVLVKNWTS